MRPFSCHGAGRAEASRSSPTTNAAPKGEGRATDLPGHGATQARWSENPFRDVIENSWDGAMVLDEYGYVRFLNSQAREILGPQSDKLLGANFGLPAVGRRGVEIEIARASEDDRVAEMRVVDGRWNEERAPIVLMRYVTSNPSSQAPEEVDLSDAVRKVTNALTTPDGETGCSAEDLVGRLCRTLVGLAPGTEAHAYLLATPGDFVHAAQSAERRSDRPPPARFSNLEIEELWNTCDGDRGIALDSSEEGEHALVSKFAARLGRPWVRFAPLRDEAQMIGLLVVAGTGQAGPAPGTKRVVQEAARAAGPSIASARLRAEVARLERTRSEILSMVSHELRSPLHVILGYENLLRDGELGELSDEQHDALVRIGRNARQLANLVENTLTAGRVDVARVPAGAREVALRDITFELEEEVSTLHDDSTVALRWDVPEDLPRLYTEPENLKLILRNLVSNALKFTDRGTVSVSAERAESGIAVHVTDTGVGIPHDELEAIFGKFRQLRGEGTQGDGHGGVGLGLYIVHRMIEKLEGSISVESEPSRGSTFTIWLPLRPGTVPAAA